MKISFEEWRVLCLEADKQMKATNGHAFMRILKTRCQRCGRSPKQKGKCPAWLNTYMDNLYRLLTLPKEEDNK